MHGLTPALIQGEKSSFLSSKLMTTLPSRRTLLTGTASLEISMPVSADTRFSDNLPKLEHLVLELDERLDRIDRSIIEIEVGLEQKLFDSVRAVLAVRVGKHLCLTEAHIRDLRFSGEVSSEEAEAGIAKLRRLRAEQDRVRKENRLTTLDQARNAVIQERDHLLKRLAQEPADDLRDVAAKLRMLVRSLQSDELGQQAELAQTALRCVERLAEQPT